MVCGARIRCDDALMTHALFRAALLFTMLLPLQACGFVYKAEPIQAWVVDAETHQPLEGVIVVAHWQLKGGLEGGNPVGQMMVMETVTDAKGRFYFPGWGPKPRSLKGRLKTRSPGILLFKSGYAYRDLENELNNESLRGKLEMPLRSDWHGKTIEMERFKGTMEAYKNNFESFNRGLERIAADNPGECGWRKIPNTIRAMNHERVRLMAHGVNPDTLSSVDRELLMNDDYFTKKGSCGSPKEFFKDIQK